MDIENTASFPEESLDDIFELDIRVSSTSDEEISLPFTDIDCAPCLTILISCA